jgi:hypothetical protein
LGALGEGMMAAGVAFEARDVVMQRDALPNTESFHARTDTDDGAGGFVSEDARRRHRTVVDFFDVGWTNAASGDLDKDFVRADARDGQSFKAKVVWAAIDDGAHGFRNFEHANVLAREKGWHNEEGVNSEILSEIVDPIRRKFPFSSSPFEFHSGGVQGVVGKDEALALFGGQPVFDEVEIEAFVSAVKFVADDGMTEVGQVDANLVFTASVWSDPEECGRYGDLPTHGAGRKGAI